MRNIERSKVVLRMSSIDNLWTIERYLEYKDTKSGKRRIFSGCSYGCPDLGLMGYVNLKELFSDMEKKIMTKGDVNGNYSQNKS